MATIMTAADNTYDSQTKNQRDIITQSVLSIALGLAAFLAFCVSRSKQPQSKSQRNSPPVLNLDFEAKMDGALCGAQAAEECCFKTTRIAQHFSGLDPSAL